MYVLYYYPDNASMTPHMTLREIGVPFELRIVDRKNKEQKSAEYLALNPNGLIPVLVADGVSIYETGAITMYLTDAHPEAGLAPAFHSALRPHYYKWMFHLSNALQSEYRAWYYAHEYVADPSFVGSVKVATADRLTRTFERIGSHLKSNTWLLGDQFSAADLYLFMLTRWGMPLPVPPGSIPSLADHACRVTRRPAVIATLRDEGVSEPFV
jgi:glutathione S-transferase